MRQLKLEKSLADTLHLLMSKERMSSSALGDYTGIPAATIRKLRTGENANPTLNTLAKIARYFNITISQLIGEDIGFLGNTSSQDINLGRQVLPVLTFLESATWTQQQHAAFLKHHKVVTIAFELERYSLSTNAYAISIEDDDHQPFVKGGIVLVDPNLSPAHNDYILVQSSAQSVPNIRRLVVDEQHKYLQPLIVGISDATALSEQHNILGVVVAYLQQKWYKERYIN